MTYFQIFPIPDDVRQSVMDLNSNILTAEEAGKPEDIEKLLTDDFFIVRGTGKKLERADYLNDVPRQAHRGRQATQPELHQVGGCIVFTCIVSTTQNPDGTTNVGRFWNTRLWVNQNGQWRCAVWQVTRLTE